MQNKLRTGMTAGLLLAGAAAGAAAPMAKTYDPAADAFYRKPVIHATWIMIWNGSTEKGWWKPEDYKGCRVNVGGRWQSINWNDRAHIKTYFDAMKAAGMDLILVDFTNGFRWEWQGKYVQQLCHANGMKFAVAFNPQAGKSMESGCRKIWETYAGPSATNAAAYFHQDGKPLAVLYTWRKGYVDSIAQEGEFRRKFTTVWASGEDSDRDKWGWQLEPGVGPVPSTNVMFVTGSVKFDSPRTSEDRWRRHLAWLDYGFLMAAKSRPRVLVVGSFDDVHERNAWMVADTRDAKPGWQTRNTAGALDAQAYYRRVTEWVGRGKPSVVPGGLLKDGAYRMLSADDRMLGLADNRAVKGAAVLLAPNEGIEGCVWLYHLGRNEYRLIKLNAGLPFEACDEGVVINWDSDQPAQRWSVARRKDRFVFTNVGNGRALDRDGARIVTRAPDETAASQGWKLVEIATLP